MDKFGKIIIKLLLNRSTPYNPRSAAAEIIKELGSGIFVVTART